MAALAVTTVMARATVQQFTQFVNAGVLLALCNLLQSNNCNIIINTLTGLTKILGAAEKMGQLESLTILIKKNGGLNKIEDLQYDKNDRVYKKSFAVLKQFFSQRVCTLLLYVYLYKE